MRGGERRERGAARGERGRNRREERRGVCAFQLAQLGKRPRRVSKILRMYAAQSTSYTRRRCVTINSEIVKLMIPDHIGQTLRAEVAQASIKI